MRTKQALFTAVFVGGFLIAQAQSKYEYLVVQYNTLLSSLSVSIDGAFYTTETIELPKAEKIMNANPFLKKIKEFQDKGWEVTGLTNEMSGLMGSAAMPSYFGYMRKSRQ